MRIQGTLDECRVVRTGTADRFDSGTFPDLDGQSVRPSNVTANTLGIAGLALSVGNTGQHRQGDFQLFLGSREGVPAFPTWNIPIW